MESPMPNASPLFRLTTEERAALEPFLRARSYADGAVLFRQGTPPDGCFLLESGEVALSNRLPGDLETQVELLQPGDLIGEAALIGTAPRTQTATARGEVTVLHVESHDLFALKALISPAHATFLRALCTRLANRMKGLLQFPRIDVGARRAEQECGPLGTHEAPGSSLPLAAFAPKLRCLRDVGPRDLDLLLRISQRWDLPPGRWLYVAGDTADTLHIILRGAVETRWPGQPEGRRLGLWGPGRVLDPIELVLGGPRVTESRTREPTILLSFARADYLARLARCEPLACKLLHATAIELLERLTRATRLLATRALASQLALFG